MPEDGGDGRGRKGGEEMERGNGEEGGEEKTKAKMAMEGRKRRGGGKERCARGTVLSR